jgi:hypothetical protein
MMSCASRRMPEESAQASVELRSVSCMPRVQAVQPRAPNDLTDRTAPRLTGRNRDVEPRAHQVLALIADSTAQLGACR